jgi:hypothetical protein
LLPRTKAVGSPAFGNHGDLGLVAADMSEITDIGLELVPVALVGKSDDGVEILRCINWRTRAQRRSRSMALNLPKPKPLSPLFIMLFVLTFFR